MAQATDRELVDRFEQFYRSYYREDIGELAQRYPNEQRSLRVDWGDLYRFDPDVADDYLAQPDQLRDAAAEALRLFDLPIDVSLGQAHVRVFNLPEATEIRDIRARDVNTLVAVSGIVRKATDVRPKVEEAAFECQRCGTLTYIPQAGGGFQEPHECGGCERQGPFRINYDQSTFIDAQKLRVQERPEGLRGGETPQAIDVHIEDDIAGRATPGDHVTVTGVLRIEQQENRGQKTRMFDVFMDGHSLVVEDEEFEEMDIDDEDVRAIVELSRSDDIYGQMVDSIAPSIYGYEEAKLAMTLQLFSGITKHLPDETRIRGDMHVLLIGDPGTGKSALLQYIRHISPRSIYTSGKGSTSAGLTASAVRDDFGDGNQWTLEAGALVLADKGVAAVDELDKMRCVTGDTLIQMADGEVVPIRDLARRTAGSGEIEDFDNGRTIRDVHETVYTMTDDGRIVTRPVTAVHEYEAPEELIEVTLESGETLTTTIDHPFFVMEDGVREERPARELTEGDWTFVPRYVPSSAADGGTVPVENRAKNRSGVSPAKGAVLGYLAGDGNITYNRPEGVYGIRLTNKEEQLLGHFEDVCEEAFGDRGSRYPSDQRADGIGTVQLRGKRFADEILDAGANLEIYDGKTVPRKVTKAHRDTKAAFIRALADSEGSVDSRNVRIASSSYRLLLGVKQLLLGFGVSCQIQHRPRPGKRDAYLLAITSKHSLESFRSHIGFTLDRKQRALEAACDRVSGDRTIIDVLPDSGDLLKRARNQLRLYQAECGIDPATYCNFENGDANVSLHRAERILGTFEDRLEQIRGDRAELVSPCPWERLESLKRRYHVSQSELAAGIGISQPSISERWGEDELREPIRHRLGELLEHAGDVDLSPLREFVRGDVKWRRVKEARRIQPEEGHDDRIPILQHRVAELLDRKEPKAAVEFARDLLDQTLEADDWGELRAVLERHDISFQVVADVMDVSDATISRWFTETVRIGNFDAVRSVCFDLVEEKRRAVKVLLDEIDDRSGEPKVYDLTVDGTHNFIANGLIVHNSEDRSAMHEALEQQSYHPYSEVLLADGRRVPIGDLVDNLMSEYSGDIVTGVDCDILPVDDLAVHSVDLETNEVSKVPVDRISRHEAPDEFVQVTFSNGRSVTVTPEHPMFVDDGDGLRTVDARDVEEGTFVPAPRNLPNSAETVPLAGKAHRGRERDVALPSGMSPELAEVLGFLVAEGHSHVGSFHEIGFSNQDPRLLDRVERLMRGLFGFGSDERTNREGTVTKRWISTELYRWFSSNFPGLMHTERGRRIPAKVLGASEEEIRRFLVGAFAGDGGVESEPMAFSTSSDGLANDYADALGKIGVASRIHYDSAEDSWKTYVMEDSIGRFVEAVVDPAEDRHGTAQGFADRCAGDRRHPDVLPTSAARALRALRTLLGLHLTGEFRDALDEGYGVRLETVERHLHELRRRAVAVHDGLDEAETLSDVRSLIGWSGRQLAERLDGVTTDSIHHAEIGGYDAAKRERLTDRARIAVLGALDEVERRADTLESRCDLRYYRVSRVETVPNAGEYQTEWVYDVTVEPTNTFVGQGVVLHNSVSISKAGINATLKARCALLGAANPKYGRFDQYEPIGEQIDLEPALVSRFDLIFTVTDQPDEERDSDLADHILRTNYTGELNTQRTQLAAPNVTAEEVERTAAEVAPAIEPALFRKYVAYAKRNVFPAMTDEARARIKEFYVDLRARGTDQDAPVPITARKLEALVRLAEASARVRLSDTVEVEDAERVIGIVRSCLRDIGVDPETGQFDADVIETGTSKSQRDRIKTLRGLIEELESEYDEGAPVEEVLSRASDIGMDEGQAEHEIEKLRQRGEIYEPATGHLRTT